MESISNSTPGNLALPKEAHELFLKMCAEAGSQGSLLGSMRYLERAVRTLADKLAAHVAAIEEAERRRLETERPAVIEGTG